MIRLWFYKLEVNLEIMPNMTDFFKVWDLLSPWSWRIWSLILKSDFKVLHKSVIDNDIAWSQAMNLWFYLSPCNLMICGQEKHEKASIHATKKGTILNADRLHPSYYLYMPPDCRHTDCCSQSWKWHMFWKRTCDGSCRLHKLWGFS